LKTSKNKVKKVEGILKKAIDTIKKVAREIIS